MLAAALVYAERGVPVFPVWEIVAGRCACGRDCGEVAGKHPRWRRGDLEHGLLDATTDATMIQGWWTTWPRANIGSPTIWASVVDVDPRHGGDATLTALEAEHGALPETPEVLTGGGGRHLYFRPVPGLRSRAGVIGPGVDVRADGGYVLLPPSTHVSGRVYCDEVSRPLFETPLAEMPGWLVTLAARNSTNRPGPAPPIDEVIAAGQRNQRLTSLAGSMRRRGMTGDEILAALVAVNARCRPPLDAAELRDIAHSIGRYVPADDATTPLPASEGAPAVGWSLYDVSEPWDFPPVTALIDHLLPTKGIVWWGGLPKRYKSLFAMYVALALACRRSDVAKKFLVRAFPKILYVAREDGGSRLQERRDDILSAWTERPEPGTFMFCIRPQLDLLNVEHITWLRETCLKLGTTMLWLDTWTALSPSADPLGAKDQARLAAVVVQLCEEIGGLVIVVDHSRKNRPDGQPLSSADIFGPPQKWAAAEHIVMLDVVDAGRRLEVFIEGKDLETRRFFLTVTPRGSGEEKFAYAGSVEELADAQRQVGDQNRQAVLETLRTNPEGLSTGELVTALQASGVTLSRATVKRHCQALVTTGQASLVGAGRGRDTRYTLTGSGDGVSR
jgi:Bifunctional DNA primase/polymerase, N-terminal/Primase C terminal 1 (PriCT-1)/AAA domain